MFKTTEVAALSNCERRFRLSDLIIASFMELKATVRYYRIFFTTAMSSD